MLYGIQKHLIDEVWDEVRPWIAAACKRNRGKYDENDIRIGLLEGEDQLWIWRTETAYAIGITRLCNYPKQRVCTIRIVTGTNAAEWQDQAMPVIRQWAKANGCAAMELCARKGWARRLKKQGFEMTHVYLEVAL
ncbi:hypothetical protein [Paraburkholderia unamae]|uniref:N-acetyltransferase domain-containing protein n=1 Tax=Paraburkholderia unamae TaxID=219649 RepID=A0ABX5KLD5_9BURK|nr:hypothetical protein [Paraburkholderia unamae]PVX77165.1 hypothetical protein C7402_115224 [Paraburkholderia unamae]